MPATNVTRVRGQAAGSAAVLSLVFGAVSDGAWSNAHAAGRFGDSTWVAPGVPAEADISSDGPRVAPPDRERGWETALRLPFRIAFAPLRFIAIGVEATAGIFGPALWEPSSVGPPNFNPTMKLYMTQGSGLNDTGFGVKLQRNGFPTADSRFWIGGTWSPTDRRRLRVRSIIGDGRFVSYIVRGDFDRKPNRVYYGIGNNAPESNQSYFLIARSDAETGVRFGRDFLRQVRLIVGVSSMSPSRAYNDEPRLEEIFTTAEGAPFARKTTQELFYGITGDYAVLDDERDPSRGLHGRFDLRSFYGVRSVDPDFSQWRFEGRAYLPVFANYRVLAFRGVYAGIEPTGDDTTVLPYYRLIASDGINRFGGFAGGRYRDRRLLLGRIEYRWQFFRRVSAIALAEWGEVAPRNEVFTLRNVHTAHGGGVRLGLSEDHAIRFELSSADEGLQARLALGGDW